MAPKNFPQEMNKFKEIVFVFITCIAFSQTNRHLFSGTIRNITGDELPFATILIENTTLGTTSDANGKFNILLPRGNYTFIVRYIGYKSFTLTLELSGDTTVVISLLPAEIRLPEVLVSGEDPAYPIIREAIQRKRKWKHLINSYKAKVYTKDTFGTDTSLGLISEAYSDLFYHKNNSLKEIVVHRRQSSNLPEEIQVATVRNFLDFNNDTVQHWGYTFITPLAESAFQFYDYKLLRTYLNEGRLFYDIEVIPVSQTFPLFSGIITIADSSYALQKVKLSPNDIFQIPFFTLSNFEFTQQFALYENRFWLPLEYHISAEMDFRFYGLKKARSLYYHKSVICYEYFINTPFEDSIQTLSTLSILPTASLDDSSYWKKVNIYPLTQLERDSYKKIDEMVKARPFVFQFANAIRDYKRWMQYFDIRYNRVEGLFVGGRYKYPMFPGIRFIVNGGYGLSDNLVKHRIAVETRLNSQHEVWLGIENYYWNFTFPLNYKVNSFSNSLTSFFYSDDYYNYFFVRGNRLYISYNKFEHILVTLNFLYEHHSSLTKTTDFSLKSIGTKVKFRNNPPIIEERLTSLLLECSTKDQPDNELFKEPETTWLVRVEQSFANRGSVNSFTSFYSNVTFRVPTMGISRLFDPYLGISISIGSSLGPVSLQRTFSLECPLSRYAFEGTFRTVNNTEFSGDNFYAVAVEHNFRNIPFIILGISQINFDIVIRAATGKTWLENKQLQGILHPTNNNYSEYTVGIGRIFDMFRIDFSYSDYSMSRYAISLMMGM